jgi:enoyl-CoA hydratase/carnithine racemase
MSPQPVRLEIDGAIATLTLDRPEVFNALDAEIAALLPGLAGQVASRDDVRVLVIRGAGASFCAGGDINTFARHLDDMGPVVRELLGNLHAFLSALRAMPQIVITSVHGAAAGAGLSLAFMGDICIAAEDARFTAAYHKLGVSPDGGGTVGIVRAAGARRALQIFLAQGSFSAQEGAAWGLINQIAPAADLDRATRELAERVARTPLAAIAATKRLVHQSAQTPMADQLNAEMEALIGCMARPDFATAVRSFVKA